MLDKSIPIVIPALHPDASFPGLVEQLFELGATRIVIVDDGSGDDYRRLFERCHELGAEILVHDENEGKGAALRDAFVYLIMGWEPIRGCVTADADGQHAPADIIAVGEEFVRGGCGSLVLGVRDMGTEGVPRKSRMGNRFINACLRTLSGIHVTDSQTGLRGIPEPLMSRCLDLEGDHFEFELQMLLMCHGDTPIREVPIATIYESDVNHQTHFRPVVDSLRIFYVSVRTFLGFSATSLLSTSLDIFLFWLLSLEFRHAGLALWAILATVVARVVSATFNFIVNRRRVFQPGGDVLVQLWRFVSVAAVIMVSSAVLVQLIASHLHGCPVVLIKIVVDVLLFFVNYQVQMRVVFGNRP